MSAKGYTLIEMVVVILLLGLMGSSIVVSSKMIDKVALDATVNQVTQGIEYAKQAAGVSGMQYNVFFFKNRMLVRQGLNKPLYKVYVFPGQEFIVPPGEEMVQFNGDITTGDSKTIYITNKKIGRQVRLTIDIATSKIRVYDEQYKTKK